jgi:hypothetical protein
MPDLTKEIFHWRCKMRKAKYLTTPMEPRQHVSLAGKPLDPELVDFAEMCKGNREMYLEDIASGNNEHTRISETLYTITRFSSCRVY